MGRKAAPTTGEKAYETPPSFVRALEAHLERRIPNVRRYHKRDHWRGVLTKRVTSSERRLSTASTTAALTMKSSGPRHLQVITSAILRTLTNYVLSEASHRRKELKPATCAVLDSAQKMVNGTAGVIGLYTVFALAQLSRKVIAVTTHERPKT